MEDQRVCASRQECGPGGHLELGVSLVYVICSIISSLSRDKFGYSNSHTAALNKDVAAAKESTRKLEAALVT